MAPHHKLAQLQWEPCHADRAGGQSHDSGSWQARRFGIAKDSQDERQRTFRHWSAKPKAHCTNGSPSLNRLQNASAKGFSSWGFYCPCSAPGAFCMESFSPSSGFGRHTQLKAGSVGRKPPQVSRNFSKSRDHIPLSAASIVFCLVRRFWSCRLCVLPP